MNTAPEFLENFRHDFTTFQSFQKAFLSKSREESLNDSDLEISVEKNRFRIPSQPDRIEENKELSSPTHTFHPSKVEIIKSSILSIPSDPNSSPLKESPSNLDVSLGSIANNQLIHTSSFAKKRRMKPRNSRTLEIGPKGNVIFESSPKATNTEVMDFRKDGKFEGNNNLLEEHLNKRNSTVIPFVRKFMSKLKNASSFRNITQLKSINFELLGDYSYFYDEVLKEQNLFEAKSYHKLLLKIKTCYESQIYRLKKLCCIKFFKNLFKEKKTVLHPYQTIKIIWDICHLIIIVFWFFYIPLLMAFEEVHTIQNNMNYNISFSSSLFLILDIFINLNTSIFKNGIVERRRVKIFKYYFKKRFFYDFLTCLPIIIDWLFSYYYPNADFSTNRILHYVKFLFFVKFRTFREISNRILEKFLLKEKFQNILALFKVFFISILVAHLFACFWYLTADVSTSRDTWLTHINIQDSTWNVKYLYSIYWSSVTMMTVGYGDITPQNVNETIVCLISVLLGCAVYAYNINSIGMILQDLNKESISFNHNINIINQFMQRKKITNDLQMRIREYLRFIWKEENAQNLEEEHKIIELLSGTLKEELLIEAYGAVLKKYPMFFANFSEISLKKVVNIIKDIKLIPEETVFIEKEQSDDLSIYFIMKGKVQLFASKGEGEEPLVVRDLGVGDYFGEVAFFSGKNRFLSARSKDFTTLFCINREEFIKVLQKNSDDFEKFCMIQDQILYYDNYFPLKLRCFSCNQLGHLAGQCHLIHFTADREKVIKTFNFYVDQERDPKFARKLRRTKALKCKKLLFLTSKKIKEFLKKQRDESKKWNGTSSEQLFSEMEDEEYSEDDDEEDLEEVEEDGDTNESPSSAEKDEESPDEGSVIEKVEKSERRGEPPVQKLEKHENDHRKSASLHNFDKIVDEGFSSKKNPTDENSSHNVIKMSNEENNTNSIQILRLPTPSLQKRHSASAALLTPTNFNNDNDKVFNRGESKESKDIRSSKKTLGGTDINQKQRKRTIESSTITSHSKNKTSTNSKTNIELQIFANNIKMNASSESIKRNVTSNPAYFNNNNFVEEIKGQHKSILKVPGLDKNQSSAALHKNSIFLNKNNILNLVNPGNNNHTNPLVVSLTTMPPSNNTPNNQTPYDPHRHSQTINSMILDPSDSNKILDNFDRVQNFKNYFPHNNCKVVSEAINMKKISSFRHSKTMTMRRKSMEARLAKYTFFLDDMKEKMPAAIKKKAAMMKKKREGFMGRLPTLKDESGYKFDEEVLTKKQKQWQAKQYFSGLFNKEQKKLNFSDVVNLILHDPFLKKQIKKKVKIVSHK